MCFSQSSHRMGVVDLQFLPQETPGDKLCAWNKWAHVRELNEPLQTEKSAASARPFLFLTFQQIQHSIVLGYEANDYCQIYIQDTHIEMFPQYHVLNTCSLQYGANHLVPCWLALFGML